MQFPERPPKGKRVPFQDVKLGCGFRLVPQGETVSQFARRTGALLPPATSQPAFPQIKPAKINLSLFWQVLEADGEGDLMVVAGYCSGASLGLGDSAYDG